MILKDYELRAREISAKAVVILSSSFGLLNRKVDLVA